MVDTPMPRSRARAAIDRSPVTSRTPVVASPSEMSRMRFTSSRGPGAASSSAVAVESAHEMQVSPPTRMARMEASTVGRLDASRTVGGTRTRAVVSNETTVARSPSCMRSTMPTAAAMALFILSPAIEPERSTTMARCTGGGASCWSGARSAPVTVARTNVPALPPRESRAMVACPTRPSRSSVLPSTKCDETVASGSGAGSLRQLPGRSARADGVGRSMAPAAEQATPRVAQRAKVRTRMRLVRGWRGEDLSPLEAHPGGLQQGARRLPPQ
jgi:hypothetical protein